MDREALHECFYGHCMLRVLHKIHTMRVRHPALRILLIKIDLDAAYRRLHVKAAMALLTITIIEKLAYVLLRLPFGVANGPNDYSLVSEPLFDLTNDIMQDETFRPETLHSPIRSELEKPEAVTENTSPFGEARPLIVDVPFAYAATDGYIDDMITMVLDKDNWTDKAINAGPLAIYSLF
jgi:hypothetical protein